ncbi:S8 family peptidase [Phytomonospora endophytica]|uniref:Subtilisin family serine protease n=1 Tax=Phytomonospora endophytica TaxID=714109 RepID=A0A841FBJ0_9ACTN|nr:S8 family serine peptidase [Phytomonospora endophytica]MBB6033626.1 subtilisin family serine protease [Phytomonospora endophytica]
MATLTTGTAHADPVLPGSAAFTPAERARAGTVGLVTGDKVLVSPTGKFAFLPGEGREDVGYVAYTEDAEQHVIPRDALPLLRRGVLDESLFNVTGLVRDGFGDGGSLPLIVQDDGGSMSASSLDGVTVVRNLESIDAKAVEVPPEEAVGFWAGLTPKAGALSPGLTHVWLDGKVEVLLDESVPQVGAPDAWAAGYTGSGVTTAILDTGYDPTHPDLAGKVAEAVDFTRTSPGAIDGHGHGTHVASTVAGSGAASDGRYKGVAPDASLIVGKVLNDSGSGSQSGIIAGMEWAAEQGAAVVNMSLGSGPTDGTSPMDRAVNEISEATGTLFVIAAGNDGCVACVTSPSTADAALSVGSVTKSDDLSGFSSQGPRVGDYAVKPDIAAPGSAITAARATGTALGEPEGDFYTTASGTSMATPHVTGAVAILKQAHPDWTAERLKAALMGSATGLDGLSVYQQGAGRLDVSTAISAAVTPSTGSLSFGNFAHPHDQTPVGKTVTYTNASGAAVALTMSVTGGNSGLFTLDKTAVTVPAGGTAEVTVTANPSADQTVGAQSAVLAATGGGGTVRTAVGANLEAEKFDITIDATAREGGTVDALFGGWFDLDSGEGESFHEADDITVRLPAGRYELLGYVATEATGEVTAFATDVIITDAGQTVVWDARKGRRDDVNLDPKDERLDIGTLRLSAMNVTENWYHSFNWWLDDTVKAYTVPSATMLGKYFTYQFQAQYVSPDGSANPYRYNVSYPTAGKIPAGTVRTVRNSALQRDDETYHSQGTAITGYRQDYSADDGGVTEAVEQVLPGKATVYFTPGAWVSELYVGDFDGGATEVASSLSTKIRGRTAHPVWNKAPLGATSYGSRFADDIHIGAALFDDASRGVLSDSYLVATGTSVLSLNGEELVANEDPCDVNTALATGASGTATLTCTATRSVDWSPLGTTSSARWTFATVPPPADEGADLPLNSVALGSASVVNGYAPATAMQFVTLDAFAYGEGYAGTRRLTFEVSYDDGVTWKRIIVHRTGDHATASLKHPAGATFVSTRLSLVDNAGNTATVTTIRSYGLK